MTDQQTPEMQILENLNGQIECKKTIVVPTSMITNYQKFFQLAIPKNTKQITLVLPLSFINKLKEIKETIKNTLPEAEIREIITDKSENIILCTYF
ncbi:DUF4898 domain-containing protein [Acidianus manzaensis]|nr:DUF4898 domain-containing protein [Acidianus manzaensis]